MQAVREGVRGGEINFRALIPPYYTFLAMRGAGEKKQSTIASFANQAPVQLVGRYLKISKPKIYNFLVDFFLKGRKRNQFRRMF